MDHEHTHHHHDEHCGCHDHGHHEEHCGCHDHEHHDEHCGCHDHEHHDEHCGCHDHGHHEEHCGCHDHEHHHEEHCDCHDHGHQDGISISFHEGAIIGSMQGIVPMEDYTAAQEALAAQLRELHRLVEAAGGFTGHIKFILTGPAQCCQISVTDVNETLRHFTTDHCKLEGVAIVFGLDEKTLRSAMNATLGTIVTREE